MARSLIKGNAYIHSKVDHCKTTDGVKLLHDLTKKGDILLAHAEGGVIWGKATQDGKLVTSNMVIKANSPELLNETLWDVRLFNKDREILIWCDGDGAWNAREIGESGEGNPCFTEWYDEPQLLWGDSGKHALVDGVTFTVLTEGSQGLVHAVPVKVKVDEKGHLEDQPRCCLLVRHYLANGEDAARVVTSRLVGLS